jgi:hypothetical protein
VEVKVDRDIACSDADLKARVYADEAENGSFWQTISRDPAFIDSHRASGIEVRRARRRLAQADGLDDRRGSTGQAYPQLSQEEA